MKKEIDTDFLG